MSAISKSPPNSFFEIVTDQWTAPFWAAADERRLVVPRCAECGTFRMPPTPFCPNCQSQKIDWIEVSGEGTIYSYTVVSRAISPGMEESLPYVPALIELDGAPGVRLISDVVGSPLEDITIGRKVQLQWQPRPSGGHIPLFSLTP